MGKRLKQYFLIGLHEKFKTLQDLKPSLLLQDLKPSNLAE